MTPPSDPPPRTIVLLAVAVLALAGLRLLLPPPTGPEPTAPVSGDAAHAAPATDAALAQARAFLDAYVDDDGRVVRHDQGGDTVSEGQAWALVLAVAVGEEQRAAAIVDWTEDHLAREDGMLAWRWADGEPRDDQPATDADLAYAWGLARGADAFGRPAWRSRATELVERVATTSTVPMPSGPLVTAGPWASGQDPAVANPSYLWPAPLAWAADHEPALAGSVRAATALLRGLVDDDTPLVPDWVEVDRDGTVTAIGSPSDPRSPPRHGLDAVRTWIWTASSCDPELRELAARAHGALPVDDQLAAVHDLAGSPVVDWQHPATLAGAAAAAHAAGEVGVARARLDAATRLQREHPTYYGSAVTALARVLLDTDLLTDCDLDG